MSRSISLRRRFAFATASLLFVAFVALSSSLYLTMDYFLRTSLEDSLRALANQIDAGLNFENGRVVLPSDLDEGSTAEDHPEGLSERILDVDGRVVASAGVFAGRLPFISRQASVPYFSRNSAAGFLQYTTEVRDGARSFGFLQVAQSDQAYEAPLHKLLLAIVLVLPLFVPLSFTLGYFLAARLLKPIDAITRTARRISTENLSARLGFVSPADELGRLAATFDDMLDRIERSFRTQRAFTSDASHELRTPLTVVRTILDVTRQRSRSSDDYRKALEDIGQVVSRMENLVDRLLTLARLDNEVSFERRAVDFSALCEAVATAFEPRAAEKGLKWKLVAESGLIVEGNEVLLESVLENLLQNAFKFTETGSVHLIVRQDRNDVLVKVRDTGSGIPVEDRERVFERFYRSSSVSAVPGSGLGLAIVERLVRWHNGTIGVDSVEGLGTTFIARFPLAQNLARSRTS